MKTQKLSLPKNKPAEKLMRTIFQTTLFALLALICCAHASGQGIDFCREPRTDGSTTFPVTCDNGTDQPDVPINLPTGVQGVRYTYTFKTNLSVNKVDVTINNITHTINNDHSFQGHNSTLTFSVTGGVITLSDNSPPATATDIVFNLKAYYIDDTHPRNNSDDNQKFSLHINAQREPIVLIFLLDISGSMDWSTTSNDHPCDPPYCTKRIEVLKTAVKEFLDDWGTINNVQGDKAAIAYFNNGFVAPPPNLLSLSPRDKDATINQLKTELDDNSHLHQPGGNTAMGGGLQSVLETLHDIPDPNGHTLKRVVVLFTDGDQNLSPMAHAYEPNDTHYPNKVIIEDQTQPDPDNNRIQTYAWAEGWPGNHTFPYEINTALNTLVYTVGVATSTTGTLHTLQRIAEASGLNMGSQHGYGFEYVPQMMTMDLVNAIKGNSPQIVDYRIKALADTIVTENFDVNNNLEKVLLTCSWNKNHPVTARVMKDGVDVTRFATSIIREDSYIKFFYKFPLADNVIKSGGQWQIVINGEPKSDYQAYVLVDDHPFKYNTSAGKSKNKAGDALDLSVSLHIDTAAVNAATVKAIILKPGQDIGTLFSTTKVKNTGFTPEPGTPAQQKFQQLMSDPDFYKLLVPKQQQITLKNNGNGNYTAQFTDTKETGTYQVIYSIHYADKQAGSYDRTEMVSAIVEFGKPDFAKSDIVKKDSANQTTLTIIPKNKFGNYLGPDYGSAIRLQLSKGQASVYRDNLDGSYTYTITGVAQNEDPDISISILGETFYTGNLSKIDKVVAAGTVVWKQWWFWVLLVVVAVIIYVIERKRNQS